MKILNVGNRVMNTYIYPLDNGYIMIDTGYENHFHKVCKNLSKHNIALSEIKYIFLTHAHDDHAGFLKEMLVKVPNLKVIASPKALPVLLKGQNSFNGGCSSLLSLVFCNIMKVLGRGEHKFPPIEEQYIDRIIQINNDNKESLEQILKGKILITPGHTSDSISLFLNTGIIFSGDATMNGLPSLRKVTIWIEDKSEFMNSWKLLIKQKSVGIYPSHGKPFKDAALIKNIDFIKKIKLYELK